MSDQPVLSPSDADASALPQFATAEIVGVNASESCQLCGKPLPTEYYRVNNLMACAECAAQSRDGQPKDTHIAFSRALLFGSGAALLGMIVYAMFTIVTGWTLGYIALGVGWFIAFAMKKGSHGLGGRRYQITAVALTYAAISVAAVPIGISYAMKNRSESKPAAVSSNASPSADTSSSAAEDTSYQPKSMSGLVVYLLAMGLASPFLDLQNPGSGVLGLIILFVGLRIAWQLTAAKPLEVDGPYQLSPGRA